MVGSLDITPVCVIQPQSGAAGHPLYWHTPGKLLGSEAKSHYPRLCQGSSHTDVDLTSRHRCGCQGPKIFSFDLGLTPLPWYDYCMIRFDDITPDDTNQQLIEDLSDRLDGVSIIFVIELLGMRLQKTPHEMLEDPMILEMIEGSQSSPFARDQIERIFDIMIED